MYLETFGTIDGAQWTKHAKDSEDFHHGHGSIFDDDRDQRDGDNDDVENVETIATERSRMQDQTVGDDLTEQQRESPERSQCSMVP